MFTDEFLYHQSEFLIIGALFALLLIATEIGFRRGHSVESAVAESTKSAYWSLQAGVMGLLALLLAFTFSMAVSRYETRKQLLVDETNAIGTAYLRSRMLPEPYRSEIAKLTDAYVASRLQSYSEVLNDKELQAANLRCRQLQEQLWIQAMGVAATDPHQVPTGLFVSALNDAIDMAAKRNTARENHVPQPVLIFLFLFTILTMTLLGYGCGLGNRRNFAATAAACVLASLVILTIMDLDRPRRGLITISQTPMLELRASLK